MGLLDFFRGKRPSAKVAHLTAPAQVAFDAVVVSPNELESPFSGFRAALWELALVSRHELQDRNGEGVADTFRLLGAVLFGDEIRIRAESDGSVVRVPVARLSVAFTSAPPRGIPLSKAPPPQLAHLMYAAYGGMTCFRERAFSHGDKVRFQGVVAPAPTVEAQGYRSTVSHELVGRADLGQLYLEEIFEAPSF